MSDEIKVKVTDVGIQVDEDDNRIQPANTDRGIYVEQPE
jgi:hypothetical protein